MFVNHCHVFPRDVKAHGSLEALVETMKECGIDKAVAFAPFEELMPPSYGDPNEWLAEELRSYPEIVGFASINPILRDSVERLEKAWSLGLVGVKLHPPIQKFRINDPQAYRFYSKAEDLGVILDFHTGVHGWCLLHYRPLLIDDVAYTFPDLKIIIEHVGGRGMYEEALALLLNKKNVYAGISSCLNRETHKAWYIGGEKVEELVYLIGEERLIYGTDFPYNDAEEIKRDINTIMNLNLPQHVKDDILGGNLEKLLSRQ
ncbi:amidohydrolase [Candidatus Bathyarchaeota archaeon]|nr:MAG: amidohydrolase [Candidatus Bathyarchaeota archaeon]